MLIRRSRCVCCSSPYYFPICPLMICRSGLLVSCNWLVLIDIILSLFCMPTNPLLYRRASQTTDKFITSLMWRGIYRFIMWCDSIQYEQKESEGLIGGTDGQSDAGRHVHSMSAVSNIIYLDVSVLIVLCPHHHSSPSLSIFCVPSVVL